MEKINSFSIFYLPPRSLMVTKNQPKPSLVLFRILDFLYLLLKVDSFFVVNLFRNRPSHIMNKALFQVDAWLHVYDGVPVDVVE